MSNKTIKEIFDEKINSDRIYKQIMLEKEKKLRSERAKMKMGIVFASCVILIFTFMFGNYFIQKQKLKENDFQDSVKVYAIVTNDGNTKKEEIREDVRLVLEQYNLAMSMVPGYPIAFDFNENNRLDYMSVQVVDGNIFDWHQDTGDIEILNNPYKIMQNKTLYFHISKGSKIQVTGYLKEKGVVSKTIQFFSDDDFNLYGIMN